VIPDGPPDAFKGPLTFTDCGALGRALGLSEPPCGPNTAAFFDDHGLGRASVNLRLAGGPDRKVQVVRRNRPAYGGFFFLPVADRSGLTPAQQGRLRLDTVYLATDGTATTTRRVRARMFDLAPNADVSGTEGNSIDEALTGVRTGAELVLLIVLLTAAVAITTLTTEGILDRRRALAGLAAQGTPVGTLARAVTMELALPLVIAGTVATGLGVLAGAMFAQQLSLAVTVPWGQILRFVGETGLVGALVTALTLPVLRRSVRHEYLMADDR
jgi:hypothetical protein